MLMEWLEPKIKMQICDIQLEAENVTVDLFNQLLTQIHKIKLSYPNQSKECLEIEEIFNEMLLVSVDFGYRHGFTDCMLLKKID